jgi:hypothetical protein
MSTTLVSPISSRTRSHGLAFEREALFVRRVRVARRPAKADHRVVLEGFEVGPTQQAGVLVRLEVRHPYDDGLGPERRGDRADPFGEPFDEELLAARVVLL